ncbi:MAG: hypothetical protein EA385_16410 [Salinarimonadaceae bacterium]|nr:MAG: hypothetical protein EA385_16410 [Salinarimonadaceae bacterium]
MGETEIRDLRAGEKIFAAQVRASDNITVELLVALEAAGALSRREIAQTLLRARIRTRLMEDDDPVEDIRGVAVGFVDLIAEFTSDRLGAAPEFGVLRREIEEWERSGRRGEHPCTPSRRGPSRRAARRNGP